MKKICTLLFISLCLINIIFAQDNNEREAFDLVLAIDEKQYFSAKIEKSQYVIMDKIIQIFPDEKVYIEADILNNDLTNLKRVDSVSNPKKTMTIEFKQVCDEKKHKYMMLFIENPYKKKLHYSANIYSIKYDKWFSTDVYDVEAGMSNYEIWPDLISSITLDSLKLVD